MSVPKSFAEYFDISYEKFKENGRPAFKYMKDMQIIEVSADTFMENLKNMSDILYKAGCSGEHVGIMGKISVEMITTFCALVRIGASPVLLNKDYSTEEIAVNCKKTDTFRVYCDEKSLAKAPKDSGISMQRFPKPLEQAEHIVPPAVDINSLCYIMFTSGTTGGSKAVMLPVKSALKGFSTPYEFVFSSLLTVLPLHHISGLGPVINGLFQGATICIGTDPGQLQRYLKSMRPEYMFAVPAIVNLMAQKLERANQGEDPLFGLRIINSGGAKFPQRVIQIFEEHNKEICQVYAATESGGWGTFAKMNADCPDTIGWPSEIIDADIRDGELILKGDTVMMGYYGEPELTSEVLIDGWYHTGDLCCVDEQGRYYLTGRKKNLIILSNGENISPEEIEGRISPCPHVTEVLVKEKNDFLCAEIFAEEMAEQPEIKKQIEDFIDAMNANVPTYKRVHFLEFRDTPFEKTAVGKIKRT